MSHRANPGMAWKAAEAELAAKMVAELGFEGALAVVEAGPGRYEVGIGPARYGFRGRPVALASWRIEPASLRREGEAADPFGILLDLHAAWGLDPAVTALTVTELSTTLAADAALLGRARSASELADLPHHELEGHQTGHPWLIMNKGRVGFGAADTAAYAPESRRPVRLEWMAVHRSLATFVSTPALTERQVRNQELDAATQTRFDERIAKSWRVQDAQELRDHRDFVLLPVHPWQWDEVVATWFAPFVAQGLIIPVGEGPGEYLPQQSIRTFTALEPRRFDVKLPLSILNTMVYRGIPGELVAAAPVTTAWLHAVRDGDPFLAAEHRLVLPGEVAAVAVRHPVFDALPAAPYRYRQLLGVIWREPLAGLLADGERGRTMASLLHVDPAGRAFVAELVDRSGLDAAAWVERLLAVVLPPLLHLMWRHGIVLNPHGENATVIYAGDVPVRLAVKDFVDDLKLLDGDTYDGLPEQAHAVLLRCTPSELVESFAKSLLLGVFRYLAPLCEEHLGLPEDDFWAMARSEVTRYQERFPQLAGRFALLDLTGPTLPRVCLNRERLLPGGYHDRAERDAHVDVDAPPLANPLHPGGR